MNAMQRHLPPRLGDRPVWRRSQTRWFAFWLWAVVLTACADLDAGDNTASSADTAHGGDAPFGDVLSTDTSDVVIVNTRCPARDEPSGDDDQDGLPNEIEDINRNCQQDPDETSPTNPDSDGDGLSDGQEDINANGLTDFGELNPRLADTNDDGILDANEPLALVCNRALFSAVQSFTLTSIDVSLALPQGFSVVPSTSPKVAFFGDAEHTAFGFVILTRPETSEVASEQKRLIERVTRETSLPLSWRTQRAFVTPSDEILPARPAASGVLDLSTSTSALSAGQSRDTVLSAIMGEPIRATLPELEFCEEIEAHITSYIQADGLLLTAGVLACKEDVPALSALVQDLASASLLAPAELSPSGFLCQQQGVKLGAGEVDILWVVDNSASMRDERERVQRLSQALVASLQASPMDWRLGVTTTESYLLDELDRLSELTHDDWLDPCSGLRGGAFLSATTPDVASAFERFTLSDPACDLSSLSVAFPIDANLCGLHEESGLLSAAALMRRTDPNDALCGPQATRRASARQVIFWLSDEDDWLLTDPLSGAPLLADDPQRHTFTRTLSTQFQQLGAQGCAIVGDAGTAAGGLCSRLTSETSAGALDGLGYREVAAYLGGVSGSICNRGDSQTLINACLGAVAGFGQRYEPSSPPIFYGLQIAVDGKLLTRGIDWERDPTSQAIVLKNVSLNERSRIAIAFPRWR